MDKPGNRCHNSFPSIIFSYSKINNYPNLNVEETMAQPRKKRIILFSITTIFLGLVLLGACTPVPDATHVSFATAACSTTTTANSAPPTHTTVYVGSYEMGTPTGAAGSRDLYALNDDGTLRWRCTTSTSGGFSAAPVIDQGTLYALAGSEVYFKATPPTTVQAFYALRQNDGKQRWQFAVEGMNSSGPLISNGTIYIAITTTTHESMPVSHPAFVFALQATTGKVLWQALVGDGGDGRVLLVASRETIYVATEDGVLTALSARNGTQQWHYQTNCRNDDSSTLIASGDRSDSVYMIGCTAVSALQASTGKLLWNFQTNGEVEPQPLVNDGILYIASSNSTMYAIRTRDGKVVWQRCTGDFSLRPAAIMDGVIYVSAQELALDGSPSTLALYAFRSSDGAMLWRYQHEGENSSLVTGNGMLYLGVFDPFTSLSSIVALRASNGTVLWQSQSDATNGSLNLSNGVLYISTISSAADYVAALRTDNGTLLWRYTLPYNQVHSHTPLFLTAPVIGQSAGGEFGTARPQIAEE
jgi:outer membrane protein assembly factor BamB